MPVSNPPFRPREIVIDLPTPPSVNSIWKRGKGGHVYLDKKYEGWKQNADAALNKSRQVCGLRQIPGLFTAQIIIKRTNKNRDIDNAIKVILDFAQRINLIANDKFCEKLTAEYGECPAGARLILTDMEGIA